MRAYQIQLEQDYQDTYGDFIQVSEMILKARGDERQALLTLRKILKNTIKVMERELEHEPN
jgi:hypothetical protein